MGASAVPNTAVPNTDDEDLDEILTCLVPRSGANGPNAPGTRRILRAAADHLQRELAVDLEGHGAPRLLSAILGHESFAKRVMGVSVHQMRRRWPTAPAWYADVIAYAARSPLADLQDPLLRDALAAASELTLGETVETFMEGQAEVTRAPGGFRVSDCMLALWPSYAPVAASIEREHAFARQVAGPFLAELMAKYLLAPRSTADLEATCRWVAVILIALAGEWRPDSPTNWGVESVTLQIAGLGTDPCGRVLPLDEMRRRRSGPCGSNDTPIVPFDSWPGHLSGAPLPLDHLSTQTGPNGPDGEMTLQMLDAAAQRLAELFSPEQIDGVVPRGLSAVLGHESFVRNRLKLSVHQMRRRWTTAPDWYEDLVAYILRPSVSAAILTKLRARVDALPPVPFATLAAELTYGHAEITTQVEDALLGDALSVIWPDFAPVARARERRIRWIDTEVRAFYQEVLDRYRLRIREGADLGVVARASFEAASGLTREAPDVEYRRWAPEALTTLICGATEELDGTPIQLAQLRTRIG